MAPLVATAAVIVLRGGSRNISDLFFWEQDALVALVMTASLRLLPFAPLWTPPATCRGDRMAVFDLAVLVALVAYGGVFDQVPGGAIGGSSSAAPEWPV
jgi:hypothetical protein